MSAIVQKRTKTGKADLSVKCQTLHFALQGKQRPISATGLPVPLRLVRQVPPQRCEVASKAVTGTCGASRPSTLRGRAGKPAAGYHARLTCKKSLEQGRIQMPKGYWVTTYRSIKDPDKLAAYAKLAPVALAPFGVKYIVRGTAAAASEAGIKQRVVISVFDTVAKAIAAHDSPAYQAAVKVLGDGAERDVRIVEGLE